MKDLTIATTTVVKHAYFLKGDANQTYKHTEVIKAA